MGETFAEALLVHETDEGPALLFEEESWSWAAFFEECRRRVSVWHALRDPARPPHIGVLLDNVPDYLFWLGAGALAGATIVGINSTYRGSELARLIDHTDCQVLVTEDRHRPLLDGLELDMPASRVLQIDQPEYREALRTIAPASAAEAIDPETLQLLIFTSGSTAAPKAVRCTQGRLAQHRETRRRDCQSEQGRRGVPAPSAVPFERPLYGLVIRRACRSTDGHSPEVLRLGVSPRCPALRRDVHRLYGEGSPIRDGDP